MTSIRQQPLLVFEKTCHTCGETKPSTEYAYYKTSADRLMFKCKVCRRARYRHMYHANPEFRMRSSMRSKQARYGITAEAYAAMLEAQQGVCAICNELPANKHGFHVDHDHTTGKVRGLLCHSCNLLLGGARDRVEVLKWATWYLERLQ